jgi:hypothetical protein
MAGNGCPATQAPASVHFQQDSGDFQQGVAFCIETCRFNIYNDGQEAPEPSRNARFIFDSGHRSSIPNRPGFGDVA